MRMLVILALDGRTEAFIAAGRAEFRRGGDLTKIRNDQAYGKIEERAEIPIYKLFRHSETR